MFYNLYENIENEPCIYKEREKGDLRNWNFAQISNCHLKGSSKQFFSVILLLVQITSKYFY